MPLDPGDLYRVLAESALDAIVTIDSASVILSVNPAAEHLFEWPADELIGHSLLRVMPERFRERHGKGMARYLDTGKRRISWNSVPVSIVTRTGREVPVEISFGVFQSEGRPVFSAILRDVSERNAAQLTIAENARRLEEINRELRQSEAEYFALANSIPTLAWVARPDGWIYWYNERWYEYTGTTPADMEGWGWQRVHDPERLPEVLARWQASIASGDPFEMTFPLRGADGVLRPFLTRVIPVRAADGAVVRWFGTNTDITNEYEARMAAERAGERVRRLQALTAQLARARSFGEVSQIIVTEAAAATGAAIGMLAMRDKKTNEGVLLGETGLTPGVRDEFARFPLDRQAPSAECLRTAKPVFAGTRDGENGLLARWPGQGQRWIEQGEQAVASLPLIVGGESAGAITFTFTEPQIFDAVMRDFLLAIAAQVAQAIERVQAFEAERRERERTTAIVEAITDGFLTLDRDLCFTYVNERAATMMGVSRDQLIGKTIMELPTAQQSPFVATLKRVVDERRPVQTEGFGTIMQRWLDVRGYPTDDGGVVAYFQDITEGKRRQDASAFLAEASRVVATEPDYRLMLQALARLAIPRLGDWCAIDLLADPVSGDAPPTLQRVALVHGDPRRLAAAAEYRRRHPPNFAESSDSPIARALRGVSVVIPSVTREGIASQTPDEAEREMIHALGLVSAMVVPLATPNRVIGALTLCTGESGRHYSGADRALAEDLASRAALAVERARLLERAEAGNAAKTEFLRTVSHELRQPLNAIGGLLQLWELGLRGDLSEEQLQDLARIKRNQHQLSRMIEDLLSFARLDAGKLAVESSVVAVHDVLAGIEAAADVGLHAKGLTYEFVRGDDALYVLADANRLHQVLVNLVTNAMKATDPGGSIRVWVDASAQEVCIRVSDSGRGIPAAMLEAIFTPFVQVGRALNQPREGAGLGLAISRGLTEAMGGRLTVTSEEGRGSTFTVKLRRAAVPK